MFTAVAVALKQRRVVWVLYLFLFDHLVYLDGVAWPALIESNDFLPVHRTREIHACHSICLVLPRKVALEAVRRALAAGHSDGQHALRLIFLLNTSQDVCSCFRQNKGTNVM